MVVAIEKPLFTDKELLIKFDDEMVFDDPNVCNVVVDVADDLVVCCDALELLLEIDPLLERNDCLLPSNDDDVLVDVDELLGRMFDCPFDVLLIADNTTSCICVAMA